MSILTSFRDKTVPFVLGGGLTVSLLMGCRYKETRTELSDVLHQEATVTRTEHRDRYTLHHLEKNLVFFEGDVENFVIDNKKAYVQFKKGDLVDISYKELYTLTFEDLNGDGIKEQTGRELTGYTFIGVQPKE